MLPKYLKDTVIDKLTSLGDHPALPPDEEVPYLLGLVQDEYDRAMSGVDKNLYGDKRSVASELDLILSECQKREANASEALQKLCCDILADIFEIPDDTINIDVRLVNRCDMDKYRLTPEPVDDFQFDDMDDMRDMSDRIYQRRMVDALVCGASEYYAYAVNKYERPLSEIDPELPGMYKLAIKYKKALLFLTEDTVSSVNKQDTGVVDVTIPEKGEMISIRAEGAIFPFLLEQAVKGLLEVAALRGLPDDEERAEYIMKKADYRLAENWDSRLGAGLWKRVCGVLSESGMNPNRLGANFVIMEIASMNPGNFNIFMQNVLQGTRKGVDMAKSLGNIIEYNKGTDDFNNFVKSQNGKHQINDDEFYSPQELLAEVGDLA